VQAQHFEAPPWRCAMMTLFLSALFLESMHGTRETRPPSAPQRQPAMAAGICEHYAASRLLA
jgi:hypothetical protein